MDGVWHGEREWPGIAYRQRQDLCALLRRLGRRPRLLPLLLLARHQLRAEGAVAHADGGLAQPHVGEPLLRHVLGGAPGEPDVAHAAGLDADDGICCGLTRVSLVCLRERSEEGKVPFGSACGRCYRDVRFRPNAGMSRSRRTGVPCRSSSSALVAFVRVWVHERGEEEEGAEGWASRRRQLRQVGERARRGVAIVSSGRVLLDWGGGLHSS